MLVSAASFALGNATADRTEIRTVEREKIVNPDFQFENGDKVYCDLGTETTPCEIIAKKSNGLYAIKYHHSGIASGDKIIIVPASTILK